VIAIVLMRFFWVEAPSEVNQTSEVYETSEV
jgi:hypothetical protein